MANDFSIKRNDTKPFIRAILQDADGNPVDLTTGSYIFFNMATNDNTFTPVISGNAAVSGTTNGSIAGAVVYEWANGDTNRSGNFLGEFEVTFTDERVATFPSNHSFRLGIFEDYDT